MSDARPRSLAAHAISFLSALALLGGLVFASFAALKIEWHWAETYRYKKLFIDGWLATLAISAIALPVSCLLGFALAMARRSSVLPLSYAARIIVELTRGTPLLVQIYLYFYVFGHALQDIQIGGHRIFENRYVIGPLILAVFAGAYISEIIRSGIESVGKTQLESARAIGLTRRQTYRHVIFPQAIRQMLPPLAGQFVSLVKDSSLLSVIAIEEFALAASNVSSNTLGQFESYLPLAIGYLIITLPIAWWTQRLEHRLRFET